MNTVKIGNKFEDLCSRLIKNAVRKGELGIDGGSAKYYKKKGYYSRDRERAIVFDLAIEIWPKNAKRCTILYLIECKSSNSKKVPVDDVEEFHSKIIQVAGVTVKGVMISDNSFQSGGVTFATNRGMMLIEVKQNDDYEIILHKTQQDESVKAKANKEDEIVLKFLIKTLTPAKIIGLEVLSGKTIEERALEFRNILGLGLDVIETDSLISLLEEKHNLKFDLDSNLESINGRKILGYCDMKERIIFIDRSIKGTIRFNFVLGHELGHFVLHREVKFNQNAYNNLEDSEYDFFLDKHVFSNDKNWLEWQANKFSSAFFLNELRFKTLFINHRKNLGISRPHHIYLDRQPVNISDFQQTVAFLSAQFKMSIPTIKYRLEELKMITDTSRPKRIARELRSAFESIVSNQLD